MADSITHNRVQTPVTTYVRLGESTVGAKRQLIPETNGNEVAVSIHATDMRSLNLG